MPSPSKLGWSSRHTSKPSTNKQITMNYGNFSGSFASPFVEYGGSVMRGFHNRGIYLRSTAFRPESYQPSGSLNMSRITNYVDVQEDLSLERDAVCDIGDQPAGMTSEDKLAAFHLEKVASDEECTICLESPSEVQTRCGHHFHLNCIFTWLETHNSCPNCRAGI